MATKKTKKKTGSKSKKKITRSNTAPVDDTMPEPFDPEYDVEPPDDNDFISNVKLDDGEQEVWWKKLGGGSFTLKQWNEVSQKYKSQIIKPKQTFKAKPSEIPKAFRDVVVPLEPLPDELEKEIPGLAPTSYEVIENTDEPGSFDIINVSTRKALNAKPLSKAKAEAILSGLQ